MHWLALGWLWEISNPHEQSISHSCVLLTLVKENSPSKNNYITARNPVKQSFISSSCSHHKPQQKGHCFCILLAIGLFPMLVISDPLKFMVITNLGPVITFAHACYDYAVGSGWKWFSTYPLMVRGCTAIELSPSIKYKDCRIWQAMNFQTWAVEFVTCVKVWFSAVKRLHRSKKQSVLCSVGVGWPFGETKHQHESICLSS